MQIKTILAAMAFIGTSIASQSSLSAVITTTYAGSANFGSGAVGYESGAIAPNPNSNTNLVSVGIGGDSFTSTNHSYDFSSTGKFNVWCVDIYHWMVNGTVTYNVGSSSDLATELSMLRPGNPDGATRVSQLVRLANQVYDIVNTKTESAAFQLAIWAITYGTADASGLYHVNTTDPGFHVGSSTTVNSAFGTLANQWLSHLNTAPTTGNYSLSYLHDGSKEFTQDVVVFTAQPNHGNLIPEPAMVALFGLGFVALGWNKRKTA